MQGKSATDFLPVGTMVSGYAPANLGPFKCQNCLHFDEGPPTHCEHPIVKSDARVKHDTSGHALVEAEACCTYFRKKA
jgi:hypothetical protein